jgi:hypothetical protein
MNTLTRLTLALCTAGLAGLMVPSMALAQTLMTRDPQVCCMRVDAAGNLVPPPFYAPKSQCQAPQHQIVASERCRPAGDPEVCCMRTDAAGKQYFFKAPKSQCTKPLQIVADARCKPTLERRVCCRTPNGFVFLPASRCRTPAHPDRCKKQPPPPQKRICCMRKGPNGPVFGFTDARRCKLSGGQIVGDGRCRPAGRICCRIKIPGRPVQHIMTDPRTCKRRHGQKVSTRNCRRVLNPTLRSPG